MAEPPIIVLAFANDQAGNRYLRDLPTELRSLQEILSEAERNGLCRLELLPNADLGQILKVFTRHRDRVSILHYAGHADSGRLLLESSDPAVGPAYAAGLATFLSQRRGLQLVFLNGCSTRSQVAGLLAAGVTAAIATGRAIDDAMARAFAVAFYTELASGAAIRASYEAARGRIQAAYGPDAQAYYTHRDLVPQSDADGPQIADDYGFPWEFRAGNENAGLWSLPDAAGNPEFGLPQLPVRDLPETPFLGLNRFTEEHAGIFFGRGYQVRELYEQITDPAGPPILLLYGASGVGKSSLLDAGMVPRLESGGYAVRYRRRDQHKGLINALRDALTIAGDAVSLAEGWRAEENRIGRPVAVFLDQVEQAFTRSAPSDPRELDEFLADLREAVANPEARAKGRLVLSFRKEWLAEIDGRMADVQLPRARMFLNPLDRRGIIAAIVGPTRPGRYQWKYHLMIEEGLPEVVADDLLADAGSAVAPTLQVLLTNMWKRALKASPEGPRFDRALYESMKSQGYLMEDVLEGGLKAIGRWNPAVEESGLALDLLEYHTTDLGTASQHTRAELDSRYAHQAGHIEGLLDCCKDRYLVIEVESASSSTRLAHDLLAPLVLRRFRSSIALGQRARRLLENRAPEWTDGKTGHVLDRTDLRAVEAGESGMRVWTTVETHLVTASRRAEEEQEAQKEQQARRLHEAEKQAESRRRQVEEETKRRLKEQQELNLQLRKRAVALGVTLVVTLGAAVIAAYLWRVAERATQTAKDSADQAKKATANEKIQTQRATKRFQIATSRQIASLSVSARNSHQLVPSLLLAAEALQAENTFEARESLYRALQDRPGIRCFLHFTQGYIRKVAFSPDGKTLAAGFDGGEGAAGGLVLWDVSERRRLVEDPLPVKEGYVGCIAFRPDGKTLAAGFGVRGSAYAGGLVLWDVAARKRLVKDPLPVEEGDVRCIAFGPDGKTLAAGFGVRGSADTGGVVLWDVAARKRLVEDPLPVKEGDVRCIAFGPDGTTLAAGFGVFRGGGGGGGVVLWDVAARQRLTEFPFAVSEGHVEGVVFSPNGKTLAAGVSGREGGDLVLWDVAARSRLEQTPPTFRGRDFACMAFDPEGKILAAGFDVQGRVEVFDVAASEALANLPLPERGTGSGSCVSFSPDSKILAVGLHGGGGLDNIGDSDNLVILWDPAARHRLADDPLPVREGQVQGVAFDPDGKTLAAGFGGSGTGGVVLWDVAARQRLTEFPLAVSEGDVEDVVFSPDGKTLAAGFGGGEGAAGGLVLWDVPARKRQVDDPLLVKEGYVRCVAFGPDGNTLAAGFGVRGGGGGGVVLWDVTARRRLADDPLPVKEGYVHSVAFGPDGNTLAAGFGYADAGGVVLWDEALRRLMNDPLPVKEGEVRSVAFSPDGKTLAAGFEYGGGERGGGVVLWDVAARRPLAEQAFPVKEGHVQCIAFSPDGKTLAAAFSIGGDPGGGGIVLWDMAEGRRLADDPLPVKEGHVGSVVFEPGGKTVAAGFDGGVVFWDVDLKSWQRIAGKIANRNLTMDEWHQYFPYEHYRATFPELPTPPEIASREAPGNR
jgi:WD40 repeat protein